MGKCITKINLAPLPLTDVKNNADNAVITEPTTVMPEPQLHTICRRWPANIKYFPLTTTTRVIEQKTDNARIKYALNMSETQRDWTQYCDSVRDLCSPDFWAFFLPLHTLSRTGMPCDLIPLHIWSHTVAHMITYLHTCDHMSELMWSHAIKHMIAYTRTNDLTFCACDPV